MRVLVTGGAGYIGSHVVAELVRAGHEVLVYDNLSRGHAAAVAGVPLICGDIADAEKLQAVMRENVMQAVMHFAAHSLVGESVANPQLYYVNNVAGGLQLLQAVLAAGVRYFVFSSSAAVYGEPQEIPIPEDHPLQPTNPYGETKVMLEQALAWYHQAYNLQYVSLRYFNAAGASSRGHLGEDHQPETHLIPLVLRAARDGKPPITIYGDDYPTPDGTAVRDYIHVEDLALAHLAALEALRFGLPGGAYNLGNSSGYSVMEVIRMAEKITGKRVPFRIGRRRRGDPAVLVAAAEKARRDLGWVPRYPGLEEIIASAWAWHESHPQGFGA